jgi:tetratricopeptide (TPR) repeat protein
MDLSSARDVIRAAIDKAELSYARRMAEQWLSIQPGHLAMSVLLAEALLADGDCIAAGRMLDEVLEADPESADALQLQAELHEQQSNLDLAWATAATLQQISPGDVRGGSKLARLAARTPTARGLRTRESAAHVRRLALVPALVTLEHHWRAGESEQAERQAHELLAVHPRLVKAHLILADCLMTHGDEVQAVAHIHQAASLDPGVQVARRLWNDAQPYVGAWPPAEVTDGPGPLPHPVAAALGWNLLSEGPLPPEPVEPGNGRAVGEKPVPDADPARTGQATSVRPLSVAQETLINIQTEINRLSGHAAGAAEPTQATTERIQLQPIYVIAAARRRLEEKYGLDGWEQIDGGLKALAKAAEDRLGVPAGVIYLDDAESLASFKLEPVDTVDPWAVKRLLDQLDTRLEEQVKEIGWLLLIGGPDVVAFHRLPNPTEDSDVDISSDNPYGCRDDNYFLPQRAVGRIPDGIDSDPTPLLRGLSTALAAHHAARRAQGNWWSQLLSALIWLLRRRPAPEASFGYTASVWRRASLEVFSKIGSTRGLRISPPVTSREFNSLALGPSRYGYFNLHGIADGPAWYGQRDPTFPADYPDFPIALSPEDVGAQGFVPEVVFTEACYGALIDGKTADTALALKFLGCGAQMVVGSTSISYGGLNASLEAADLLAALFWQELLSGSPGGRALQQAKIAFARHLDERQGYLDGEDQKTLISFLYYGDPSIGAPATLQLPVRLSRTTKTWQELTNLPPTVYAKTSDGEIPASVSEELVAKVRARVAGYLPGMEQATLAIARQKAYEGGDWHSGAKAVHPTDRMVFTLRKSSKVAGETHDQLVKVTVDDAGQMLKLAVSK